jgi:iron(III) transport system substrate-binding protein
MIRIRRFETKLAALALLAMGSLTSACCAQGFDQSAIAAKARAEGRLVIYSAVPRALTDPLKNLFQKDYGVSVEILGARPVEIRERLRSEFNAGRHIADVTITSQATLKRQVADGDLEPFGDLPSVHKLRPDVTSDGVGLPFSLVEWCILANDRLVADKDAPRSWLDLLDPKWRGKLIMDDPRTNGGGHVFFAATFQRFGRDFHEKLAAQKPVISPNIALNERRVAQGEYAMYVPQIIPNLTRLSGLPVRPIAPAEGLPFGVTGAALAKSAPHPSAAKAFLEFLLSDAAQESIVVKGYGSATGYKSDKAPQRFQALHQLPLLGNAPASQADKLLALANEIYH